MKNIFFISLSLFFIISCTSGGHKRPGYSKDYTSDSVVYSNAKVIKILDGDTYDILFSDNTTERIRMEGIDAPEKGMPYYKVAKNYLGQLCFGKQIKIQRTGKDRHGRTLAYTYLPDNTELSHEMLKAGLAWHYKKFNKDSDLAALEATAKANKTGLWADPRAMAPWDNRNYHRQGISTKDSFNIQNDGE